MGIPGLTTFINNHSDRYLKYFELRDTYLVIDGNSVCCQIYNLYAKCNCTFGGDYDKFAQCVLNFFDDLLKCNVTPLVLIDGACEDKKLKTVITRTKNKIQVASHFSPIQQKIELFPLMNKEIFKDVMKEKNIRYTQCLFEADSAIAAVARMLNCPVLSYDSDFYIYGTLYIPFDTLENYIVKSSTGKGYMKRCKIYRIEYLLNSFKGLNQSILPLAAILLGNDYIKYGIFKYFLRYVNLGQIAKKKCNQQDRIEATFIWLSRYTVDKAIVEILCRLPKLTRQKILNIIKTNINNYKTVPIDTLVKLGFSKRHVAQMTIPSVNKTYKFDADINNLTYIEETGGERDFETSEEKEEENEVKIFDAFKDLESANKFAVNKLPVWFVNEYLMGNFPGYFMDLLFRRLYICPVQIEDYSYPSSNVISLKIISVIFALLESMISEKIGSMKYMIRDCNKNLVRYKLEVTDTIFSSILPSPSNFREVPLTMRRQIFNNTLEIVNMECINELLPEWKLYIICVKYWIEQHQLYELHKCCVYSVLVCLLFNIIDLKIGKHRIMHKFQNKYGTQIQSIQQKRKESNYKPHCSMNVTIIKACKKINFDDCLIAAPFFISHFKMDQKLYSNPKRFNRSIVHAFAEFQSCLSHSMNLNALLGYPYPQIKVAKLFNGTLLYNLSNNFKTRCDIEGYINTILQNSPSLWRVFHILLLKVRSLFTPLLQNVDNFHKKRKRKCKRKKTNQNVDDSNENNFNVDESFCESKFDDVNNPFSLLNFIQ